MKDRRILIHLDTKYFTSNIKLFNMLKQGLVQFKASSSFGHMTEQKCVEARNESKALNCNFGFVAQNKISAIFESLLLTPFHSMLVLQITCQALLLEIYTQLFFLCLDLSTIIFLLFA